MTNYTQLLKDTPVDQITQEICDKAVCNYAPAIEYVPKEFIDVFKSDNNDLIQDKDIYNYTCSLKLSEKEIDQLAITDPWLVIQSKHLDK